MSDDQLPDGEIARRMERGLRKALSTPPQPHGKNPKAPPPPRSQNGRLRVHKEFRPISPELELWMREQSQPGAVFRPAPIQVSTDRRPKYLLTHEEAIRLNGAQDEKRLCPIAGNQFNKQFIVSNNSCLRRHFKVILNGRANIFVAYL